MGFHFLLFVVSLALYVKYFYCIQYDVSKSDLICLINNFITVEFPMVLSIGCERLHKICTVHPKLHTW